MLPDTALIGFGNLNLTHEIRRYRRCFLEKRKKKILQKKIEEDREKIKETMAANLKKLNFTNMEINEVMELIAVAETKIQILKDSLIGSNINNDDPTPQMKQVHDEIMAIQQQLAADIKSKVAQIRERKANR